MMFVFRTWHPGYRSTVTIDSGKLTRDEAFEDIREFVTWMNKSRKGARIRVPLVPEEIKPA